MQLPSGLSLHPYQVADVEAWLTLPLPRVQWDCSEMGLGKSVVTAVALRECSYDRILIVASKSMRPEWQAELRRWWPERELAAEIDRGFTRKTMSQPERFRLQTVLDNRTHIVSPELLPKLVELHKTCEPGDLAPYDAIVFDEFHEYRSWYSKTFQAMLTLRTLYPQADCRFLSGTPLGADPLKAWPWLKLSEPAKWGNLRKGEQIPMAFRKMYGEKVESEYAFSGFAYTGVNEAMLPQFKRTTAHLISRHTVAEVGHQLPPMRFEIRRHPMDVSPEVAAADWIQAALQHQVVACFTHNHAPLDAVQAILDERSVPYVRLYAEQSVAERRGLVEQAEASQRAILATTGLVSTGVNYLANVRHWMLAQPTENPVEIQQLSKRFSRLSSKDKMPRVGFLLYREGEEFAAQEMLAKRLRVDTGIITASKDAEELEKILSGRSDESLLDTIRLLGRTLAAHGEDDDELDEAA